MSEWVVVVTERNVWPPEHGCDARIACMIAGWQHMGFKVCLVGTTNSHAAQAAHLVDDIVLVDGPSWDYSLDLKLFDYQPYVYPVIAACERYEAVAVVAEYVWMAQIHQHLPANVVKLVDTHDLMHARKEVYDGHDIHPWIRVTRQREAQLLSLADIIIAIQEEEAKVFQSMVPERRVVTVGHWAESIFAAGTPPIGDGVMIVGSNNPSNIHCLKQFLKDGWPKVLRAVPDARLRVYGRLAEEISEQDGVALIGFVPSLDPAYAAAKVVINPVQLGTGLKIKTVEALARGKAVVATSEGSAGLPDDGAFIIEDDPETFAAHVSGLLMNDEERATYEQRALSYAKRRFSCEAVMAEVIAAIQERAETVKDIETISNPVSLHTMGDSYLRRAVECWRRGAELGHIQCQLNMSWAYEKGIGVPQDDKLAAYWNEMASTQNFRSDPKIQQDRWVVAMTHAKRGGFFVEAGAVDGLGASNTYVLEKVFGWKGICVEPEPEFFEQLQKNRSCQCAPVCLAEKPGIEKFRVAGYFSGIERFLTEWQQPNWEDGETIEVEAITLHELLKRHNAPKVIDYVALDMEGAEYPVLKDFPFDEYHIRLMTIEESSEELKGLLEEAGFELVENPFCSDEVTWELFCVNQSSMP
jgi:FkbM family methyltransferase